MVEAPVHGRRSERSMLFGDALVMATGVFVVLSALALAIDGVLRMFMDDLPAWTNVFGALSTLLPVFVGSVAAWLLRGHRVTWTVVAGFAVGLAVFGAALAAFVALAAADTSVRESFPIWVVALAGLGLVIFLVLCGLVATDALKDLRSGEARHRRLDITRLASVALLIVLIAAVIVILVQDPTSEGGEALAFGVIMGYAAGFMALGAEVVTGYVSRRSRGASSGGAA